MSGDGLPPLREVIEAHGLAARKSLGQNFILDLNLVGRIARLASPLEASTIIEVGPGPGGLTRALLAHGAARVIAIERDRRCLPALAEIAAAYPGRLEVIEGDALEVDLPARLAGARAQVVANLPYNIATLLLAGWLEAEPWPPWWSRLVLMFQKEVAERIVAEPGSKAYGRLSVLAQWRSTARIRMTLPPQTFTPPPKVHSAVVEIMPSAEPVHACNVETLAKVTAAGFGQRRKTLRASLSRLVPDTAATLARLGIDDGLRAEALPVAGFCRIAAALDSWT
jgi:16S rRNA (adenine1518-N6/adenine1519-N6)-dimethyltransferase